MMKAYPEYKESGVEWLDFIPKHWSTPSLKMLLDVRDGTHDTPNYVDPNEATYPLVTSKDVTSGKLILSSCKHISQEDYLSIIKRSNVEKNDILMPMIGTVGSPILVEGELNIAIKNLALFKTSNIENKIDKDYLLYFLSSDECLRQFDLESSGGVQNFVSLGTLRNLKTPLPPQNEQVLISNFVKKEVRKVDNLISEKQNFIKLLQEKRQALISHVVTKGLNPNVPMKDSGVEWIGEIPEHWVAKKLKYCLSIKNGQDYKEVETENIEGSYPVYGSGGEFRRATDYLYDGESVLLGRKGTIDKPMYVNEKFWTVDTMFYSKIHINSDGKFLYYLATTLPFDFYQTKTALPSMTQGDLLNHPVAVPDKLEQIKIRKYIDTQCEIFDELKAEVLKSVELLKEHRTALISAAVTGKIDVREEV